MLHFVCSTEHFPLTLTLSLSEREQQAPPWCLASGRWADSATSVDREPAGHSPSPRGRGLGWATESN